MNPVESFLSADFPETSNRALRALWHAAHGDWTAAHEEAQEGDDPDSAWVHALLHREEGDRSNAGYWYRRAGKPVFTGSIEDERNAMLATLLPKRKA